MNLTGRQKDFLGRFVGLYHESQEPLHYTDVAERLGVSKITAYDMLRLLEKSGLIQSEYVLRGKGGGAGRSSIVFRPTAKANALTAQLSDPGGGREWEIVTKRILEDIAPCGDGDYRDVVEEILARLPSRQSPLLYAAEMITAIILSLQQLRADAVTGVAQYDRLSALGMFSTAGLSALGGLAVGLSFVEGLNRELTTRLLSFEARYLRIVADLDGESQKLLVSFAQEVMRAVAG